MKSVLNSNSQVESKSPILGSGYNTAEFVSHLSGLIQKCFPGLCLYRDFRSWNDEFDDVESKLQEYAGPECSKDFPVKSDVRKLIVREITGRMPFSKNYILTHYERRQGDIDYLVYDSSNPKRMVVLFSGLSPHKSYNRFSWYWDEEERWQGDTLYLFLNDLSETWYHGEEGSGRAQQYQTIIRETAVSRGLGMQQVFCVGGSMGGYAALLFGLTLQVAGVVAVNPQINKDFARINPSLEWYDKMERAGKDFTNLDVLARSLSHVPCLYLQFSHFPADEMAARALLDACRGKSPLIMEGILEDNEHVVDKPDFETVQSLIELFVLHQSQ